MKIVRQDFELGQCIRHADKTHLRHLLVVKQGLVDRFRKHIITNKPLWLKFMTQIIPLCDIIR